MDFGLSGKKGIVCAASKGLGRAVAVALAREGVNLVINSRSQDALQAAAEDIGAETGVEVIAVAADITTETGRESVLAACPNPDILINNAGGPPPGDFRHVSREDWVRAFDANMLTPILLIRAVVDGMVDRRFGRIVNITTSGVKSPGTYPQLGISIGVRSGLTGFVGVLSRQVARHNVTINALLPGRSETDRLRENLEFAAAAAGHSVEDEAARARGAIPAGRFGNPEEFGAFVAVFYLADLMSGYFAAAGMMAALLRRATEGGSYHVKVSLARSSMWVQELGTVGADAIDRLPEKDTYPYRSVTANTSFGAVQTLANAIRFSKLQLPHNQRLVPYGADPAQWPSMA